MQYCISGWRFPSLATSVACRRQAEQAERWARAEALREEERLAAEEASGSEDGASATSGASGGQSAEEQMQDAFYCVLCDKQFKSARALANHERSKKHAEAFGALRAVLEAEEALQAQGEGKDEGATSAEETDGAEVPAAADLSGVHTQTAAASCWCGGKCSQCLLGFAPMCQAVQAEELQPDCSVHRWAEASGSKHSTLKCPERGNLFR